MYCPSCGKETPEGSRFCLNCGNPLTATATPPTTALQWEYKYVSFPENGTFLDVPRGQKPPFIGLGDKTVSNALNEIWVTLERNIHASIANEVAQGWEPDPNGWGPSSIEYRVRKVGTDYWGCGQWAGYIIFGIVSYGILLLVLPFTWKFEILEPVTIKVRLRRLSQGGSQPLGNVAAKPKEITRPTYEKQMIEWIRQGNKIEAIKVYRQHTNVGLGEAKDFVDKLEQNLR